MNKLLAQFVVIFFLLQVFSISRPYAAQPSMLNKNQTALTNIDFHSPQNSDLVQNQRKIGTKVITFLLISGVVVLLLRKESGKNKRDK